MFGLSTWQTETSDVNWDVAIHVINLYKYYTNPDNEIQPLSSSRPTLAFLLKCYKTIFLPK